MPDTSSEADPAALLDEPDEQDELNASDIDPDIPDLVGEAEASVNALLAGIAAFTNPGMFGDMMHLIDCAAQYDAGLEWFEEHFHAHRVHIKSFEDNSHKTAAELEDLVRATEELECISKKLKEMRRNLRLAENRFRRKYLCEC